MSSIYGPPPGARQPHKRGAKPPRWKRVLQALLPVLVGLAAFALLVWLEVVGDGDDDPLDRREHIQIGLPRYDPINFDIPAFRPLQSADLIPSSAIHPAELTAKTPPRPLQTADIISR